MGKQLNNIIRSDKLAFKSRLIVKPCEGALCTNHYIFDRRYRRKGELKRNKYCERSFNSNSTFRLDPLYGRLMSKNVRIKFIRGGMSRQRVVVNWTAFTHTYNNIRWDVIINGTRWNKTKWHKGLGMLVANNAWMWPELFSRRSHFSTMLRTGGRLLPRSGRWHCPCVDRNKIMAGRSGNVAINACLSRSRYVPVRLSLFFISRF